jgi:hypothetical protein
MRLRLLPVVFALVFALPSFARAQEEPPPPEDKGADWSEAFERGLDLLRNKRYDESIRAFQVCIRLFPDRAVSYYNVACAYSLKKDAKHAVEWLKKSFDLGFLDLAHVSRDTDLDNVREDEAFKALLSETRKKVVAAAPDPVIAYPSKPVEGKLPLVVYLPADGTDPDEVARRILPLADKLPAIVLLVPGNLKPKTGATATGLHWDTAAEAVVVHHVHAALKNDEHPVDANKVVLVGELDGASRAFSFAGNQGWHRVVAAAGVYEKLEGDAAKDMRVYLFAPRAFDTALGAAQAARDDLLGAGGHVSIERHEGQSALPDDLLGALERGVRWTLDDRTATPASGEIKKF